MKSLLLASASPRRQELLRQMGMAFTVLAPDIDESRQENETVIAYAQRMATEKVRKVFALLSAQSDDNGDYVVLGADTCGELDGMLLHKPADMAEAKRLLRGLSGKTHTIYSAFALFDGQRLHAEVVTSLVTMRVITDAEIVAYWRTGEPCDKAGAYAIQGLGAQFIKHLSGSYSAVMGLPLYELSRALPSFGITTLCQTRSPQLP